MRVKSGPKVISFVVDGRFCDGGTYRQFGWGRYNPNLRHANGGGVVKIAPTLKGAIEALRIYGRPLRTAEIVENYHAGHNP